MFNVTLDEEMFKENGYMHSDSSMATSALAASDHAFQAFEAHFVLCFV